MPYTKKQVRFIAASASPKSRKKLRAKPIPMKTAKKMLKHA